MNKEENQKVNNLDSKIEKDKVVSKESETEKNSYRRSHEKIWCINSPGIVSNSRKIKPILWKLHANWSKVFL